jgi:pyruvate formate lyase activating enzyme
VIGVKKDSFLNRGVKECLSRREFLSRSLCAATGVCLFSLLGKGRTARGEEAKQVVPSSLKLNDTNARFTADARFWDPVGKNNMVKCRLCPHGCTVADGQRGLCEVRENQAGKYKTLVYNRTVSMNIDPVEKKPLFHFLPGTKAFSIATAGCNFDCKFCQNWQISQARPENLDSQYFPPDKIVEQAKQTGSKTIAYTYSEPTIYYEYMYDVAKLGKEQGLHSVMISNGFMNEEPMRELCKQLFAVKIDLKAFTDKFYRETCSGELKPVLHTLEVLKSIGIWYEIVVLIVPTLNDSEQENRDMCRWIVKNLGPDVPVHYSRFNPMYKLMNLPQTPVETIERCHDMAKAEGIKFVYLGNVWNHKYENTFCPKCDKLLIRRQGYFTQMVGLKAGKCDKCGESIPGVWA